MSNDDDLVQNTFFFLFCKYTADTEEMHLSANGEGIQAVSTILSISFRLLVVFRD